MRDSRSLLASLGAGSALAGAATLVLLTASAIVAFHGWPGRGAVSGSPLALPAVPAQAARAPARILVPAASGRAVVRRAASSLRRGAGSRAPATIPRRPGRTVTRTPSSAPPSKPVAAGPAPVVGSPVLYVPSAPAGPVVPSVVAPPAPVPSPVAGPVDQPAEIVAAAPGQVSDAVAGAVPPPQLAAGDPR